MPKGLWGKAPVGRCELKRLVTHNVDLSQEVVAHLTGSQNLGQVGKEMLVSSGQCLST